MTNPNDDPEKQCEMATISKMPWFNTAYKYALEFYEKDSQLDSRDRIELSRIYRSIANAQLYGGWLGFSAAFLPPFFWQFYKTNNVKGVRVPRNFLLSLPVMMAGSYFASNYIYKKKLSELYDIGRLESNDVYGDEMVQQPTRSNVQRQREMMELLCNGSATKWAAYFYMTFQNPDRRLPDPKIKLKEMLEGKTSKEHGILQNRDIFGLYTGPEAEKRHREGIQKQEQPHKSVWGTIREENDVPEESQRSSINDGSGITWNKIRERNLSCRKSERLQQKNEKDFPCDDPFVTLEEPSQSEFDAMLERERKGGEN